MYVFRLLESSIDVFSLHNSHLYHKWQDFAISQFPIPNIPPIRGQAVFQHSIIPIVSEANYVLYVSFIVNFESSFFRDAETPGPQPPLTWDPEARVSQTLETRPEGRLLRNKANTSFHPCQG